MTTTKIAQDSILFANTALTLCDNNLERAEHAVKITMGLDPDFKKSVLFELKISKRNNIDGFFYSDVNKR